MAWSQQWQIIKIVITIFLCYDSEIINMLYEDMNMTH